MDGPVQGVRRSISAMSYRPLASALALLLIGASCSDTPDDGATPNNAGAGGAAAGGVSGSNTAGAGAPAAGSSSGGSSTANAGTGGAAGMAGGGVSTGGAGGGGVSNAGSAGASDAGSGGVSGAGASGAAGTAGAGGTANEAGCDSLTSLYCDDYEMQTDGQAPTGAFEINGNGTLVVDGTKPYRGTKSVHLTAPVGSGSTVMQFNDQFPQDNLYGRGMFFFQSAPTEGRHWDLVYAVSENGFNWEIGGMFGPFLLIVDPPDTGVSSDDFPIGEWFCLQWQFSYAGEGQDHTFHAKMNGTTLMNGQFTGMDAEGNTWGAGPWEVLRVGWTAYQQPDNEIEMWIDDLAFGDQELPCPSPP